MSTIWGWGTTFYGKDRSYTEPAASNTIIEPKLISDDVIYRADIQQKVTVLKARLQALDGRTDLTNQEREELLGIQAKIDSHYSDLFPTPEERKERLKAQQEKFDAFNRSFPFSSYLTTEWLVVFFIPIFPIRSVIVHEPISPSKYYDAGYLRGVVTRYNITPVPLNRKQVLYVYIGIGIFILVIILHVLFVRFFGHLFT